MVERRVHRMSITETWISDAGLYTFVVGKSCSEITLTVNVPEAPYFVHKFESITTEASEPVRFSCRIAGTPSPTVVWLHEDQRLHQGFKTRILSDQEQHTLLLLEAFTEDSGIYTCKATNDYGHTSCSATLYVEAKETPSPLEAAESIIPPEIIQPIEPASTKEGQPARFQCHITGENLKVNWYCNDKKIKPSRFFKMMNFEDTYQLEIVEVYPEDVGMYKCTAYNAYGEASCSATLNLEAFFEEVKEWNVADGSELSDGRIEFQRASSDIIDCLHHELNSSLCSRVEYFKPCFIKKLKYQSVLEGNPIRFECKIAASPTPKFSWLYNNRPLARNSRYVITLESHLHVHYSSLEIEKVEEQDSGSYRVFAINCEGSAECAASLLVKIHFQQHINFLNSIRLVQKTHNFLDIVVQAKKEKKEVVTLRHVGSPLERKRPVRKTFVFSEQKGAHIPLFISKPSIIQGNISFPISPPSFYCTVDQRQKHEQHKIEKGKLVPSQTSLDMDIQHKLYLLKEIKKKIVERKLLGKSTTCAANTGSSEPERQISFSSPVITNSKVSTMAHKAKELQKRMAKIIGLSVESTSKQPSHCTAYVVPQSRLRTKMLQERFLKEVESKMYSQPSEPSRISERFGNLSVAQQKRTLAGESKTRQIKFPPSFDRVQEEALSESKLNVELSSASKILCCPPGTDEKRKQNVEHFLACFAHEHEATKTTDEELHRQMNETARQLEIFFPEMMAGAQVEHSETSEGANSPLFMESLKDQIVKVRENCKFTCGFLGNPHPAILWYKDTKLLIKKRKYSITTTDIDTSLFISSVSLEHAGKYTCVIINQHGMDSTTAKLIIEDEDAAEIKSPVTEMYKPSPRKGNPPLYKIAAAPTEATTAMPENVNQEQSASSSSNCDEIFAGSENADNKPNENEKSDTQVLDIHGRKDFCNAHGAMLPCAIVSFPKVKRQLGIVNEKHQNVNANKAVEHLFTKQKDLIATKPTSLELPVDINITSQFTSKGNHEQEQTGDSKNGFEPEEVDNFLISQETLNINLRFYESYEVPKIIKMMEDVYCSEGESAIFECIFFADPEPVMSWCKDKQLLSIDGKKYWTEGTRGHCRLTVESVDSNDVGQYSCTARNVIGEVECFSTLSIEVPLRGLVQTKQINEEYQHVNANLDSFENKTLIYDVIKFPASMQKINTTGEERHSVSFNNDFTLHNENGISVSNSAVKISESIGAYSQDSNEAKEIKNETFNIDDHHLQANIVQKFHLLDANGKSINVAEHVSKDIDVSVKPTAEVQNINSLLKDRKEHLSCREGDAFKLNVIDGLCPDQDVSYQKTQTDKEEDTFERIWNNHCPDVIQSSINSNIVDLFEIQKPMPKLDIFKQHVVQGGCDRFQQPQNISGEVTEPLIKYQHITVFQPECAVISMTEEQCSMVNMKSQSEDLSELKLQKCHSDQVNSSKFSTDAASYFLRLEKEMFHLAGTQDDMQNEKSKAVTLEHIFGGNVTTVDGDIPAPKPKPDSLQTGNDMIPLEFNKEITKTQNESDEVDSKLIGFCVQLQENCTAQEVSTVSLDNSTALLQQNDSTMTQPKDEPFEKEDFTVPLKQVDDMAALLKEDSIVKIEQEECTVPVKQYDSTSSLEQKTKSTIEVQEVYSTDLLEQKNHTVPLEEYDCIVISTQEDNTATFEPNDYSLDILLEQDDFTVKFEKGRSAIVPSKHNSTVSFDGEDSDVALSKHEPTVPLEQDDSTDKLKQQNPTEEILKGESIMQLEQKDFPITLPKSDLSVHFKQQYPSVESPKEASQIPLKKDYDIVQMEYNNYTTKLVQKDSTVAILKDGSTIHSKQEHSSVPLEPEKSVMPLPKYDSLVPLQQENSTVQLEQKDSAMTLEKEESTIPLENMDFTVLSIQKDFPVESPKNVHTIRIENATEVIPKDDCIVEFEEDFSICSLQQNVSTMMLQKFDTTNSLEQNESTVELSKYAPTNPLEKPDSTAPPHKHAPTVVFKQEDTTAALEHSDCSVIINDQSSIPLDQEYSTFPLEIVASTVVFYKNAPAFPLEDKASTMLLQKDDYLVPLVQENSTFKLEQEDSQMTLPKYYSTIPLGKISVVPFDQKTSVPSQKHAVTVPLEGGDSRVSLSKDDSIVQFEEENTTSSLEQKECTIALQQDDSTDILQQKYFKVLQENYDSTLPLQLQDSTDSMQHKECSVIFPEPEPRMVMEQEDSPAPLQHESSPLTLNKNDPLEEEDSIVTSPKDESTVRLEQYCPTVPLENDYFTAELDKKDSTVLSLKEYSTVTSVQSDFVFPKKQSTVPQGKEDSLMELAQEVFEPIERDISSEHLNKVCSVVPLAEEDLILPIAIGNSSVSLSEEISSELLVKEDTVLSVSKNKSALLSAPDNISEPIYQKDSPTLLKQSKSPFPLVENNFRLSLQQDFAVFQQKSDSSTQFNHKDFTFSLEENSQVPLSQEDPAVPVEEVNSAKTLRKAIHHSIFETRACSTNH
uniref:Ig-like domain-containing protein n=1 Tax=Eptatretus burgeri TaxID=7764 RepID=A0A8C4QG81_EPTBU